MFQRYKSIVCKLLCLIVSFASQVNAEDYPAPYRSYSAELTRDKLNEFDGWDEAAFARLSIEDPVLKRAYHTVFGSVVNDYMRFDEPELNAALADMRRRGDTLTPMFLKLMDENQETGFESLVLVHISNIGTINVAPYLEYARRVLRERTQTMNAGLAGCAADLLAKHGTKEDGELMKWVMETRPYVADSVTRKLDALNRRLGLPKQGTRPPQREVPSADGTSGGDSRRQVKRPPVPIQEKSPSGTSWLVWTFLGLVVSGLLVFVLRNRK